MNFTTTDFNLLRLLASCQAPYLDLNRHADGHALNAATLRQTLLRFRRSRRANDIEAVRGSARLSTSRSGRHLPGAPSAAVVKFRRWLFQTRN